MGRVILHCDANSYYASVECLYNPAIRDKPVAVAGSVEDRHGIILTRNPLARRYGVKTGEAIWQAKQKCPQLVCVPPDYPLYVRFSGKMRAIYEQYSPRVESFGLDEAWIDLSAPGMTLEHGARIADEIRLHIRSELGITVSVGVADNKIFAKLGSDIKKPDAVTLLSPQMYAQRVYPLPAGALLYVGPSTQRRLAQIGVTTIGDLARCDPLLLRRLFGKNGLTLSAFARGEDRSPVMPVDHRAAIKSVGNSTTPPHDLTCMDDVRCILYLLSESVAARLRESGLRARCISISARTTELVTCSRQVTLPRPTCLSGEIGRMALALFEENLRGSFPLRSMGLSCSMLTADNEPVQLDFTGDEQRRMQRETLERSIDDLRRRYGHQIVRRGVVLLDRGYAAINPVDDHKIHPVPFFAG